MGRSWYWASGCGRPARRASARIRSSKSLSVGLLACSGSCSGRTRLRASASRTDPVRPAEVLERSDWCGHRDSGDMGHVGGFESAVDLQTWPAPAIAAGERDVENGGQGGDEPVERGRRGEARRRVRPRRKRGRADPPPVRERPRRRRRPGTPAPAGRCASRVFDLVAAANPSASSCGRVTAPSCRRASAASARSLRQRHSAAPSHLGLRRCRSTERPQRHFEPLGPDGV